MARIQHISSYLAFFDPAQEGGYNVSFPDFPGCVTFGESFEQAQKSAKEVLELWIEELRAQKKFIPRRETVERPVISEVRVAV